MKEARILVEWNDRFKLGIPLIDSQHANLIQQTNNLYWSCLQNTELANRYFIETAREAVNYVKHHFSTEEKLMLISKFRGYTTHKKEHEAFIKEVLSMTQDFTNKKNFVPNRFVRFLQEWVLSHIAVCDKEMADYFNLILEKRRAKLAHAE